LLKTGSIMTKRMAAAIRTSWPPPVGCAPKRKLHRQPQQSGLRQRPFISFNFHLAAPDR